MRATPSAADRVSGDRLGLPEGIPTGTIYTFARQALAWFYGSCPVDGKCISLISGVRMRYT